MSSSAPARPAREQPHAATTPMRTGDVGECHLEHCRGCKALMLCAKPGCVPEDHVCYTCAHVARQKAALALAEVTPT